MFKKTKTEYQLDLFSSSESMLKGKSKDFFNNSTSWHNVFRNQVCARIDESIFIVLFSTTDGAPNASIRVMVSMMIIKEGQGWSDAQLFEQCRYNLLIRSALGLLNMDDAVPTESTYYLFRKKINDYEKATGIQLLDKIFDKVTHEQIIDFEVSGKKVRMDSKLLGSNIAWYSRYEIVHESLRLFWKEHQEDLRKELEVSIIEQIDLTLQEEGNKIVYKNSKTELLPKLQELGILIHKLLNYPCLKNKELQYLKTLSLVFEQQFKIEHEVVVIRPKEEIKSDSIQSPHDTDCHYRNKDGNQVKGFSINITETCNDEGLNLILNSDVRTASESDCNFLENGIQKSEAILEDSIESAHTDGAYHSPENQKFCEDKNIDFVIPNIQGSEGQFDLSLNNDNELVVVDKLTNEIIPAIKMDGQEKWSIKISKKNYRYFTLKDVETSMLRKKLKQIPIEILNIRNNVEATIFQLGYHYPNDKSRYRGLTKHKMWANTRCLWVNFVRILNYLKQQCQRTILLSNLELKNTSKELILTLNLKLDYFLFLITFVFSKKQFSLGL